VTGGSITPNATTDATGNATATFIAPETAGTVTVQACAGTVCTTLDLTIAPKPTNTAVPTVPTNTNTAVPTVPTNTNTAVPTVPTNTNTAVPAPVIVVTLANPGTIVAGSSTNLVSTVTKDGQPLSGQEVTFTVTGGSITPNATTDATGNATATFIAPETAGTVTVQACAGTVCTTLNLTIAPKPTNTPTNTPTDTPTNTPTDTPTNTPTDTATPTPVIVVTLADPGTIVAGSSTSLVSTVTKDGQPLSGQEVTFTVTGGGSITPNATTDATGNATATFIAPETAGTVTVQACVGTVCTTLDLTIAPKPTNTPTNTPTDTPTNTPTDTPTNTPTDTPTNTPTDTPTPTQVAICTPGSTVASMSFVPSTSGYNFGPWNTSTDPKSTSWPVNPDFNLSDMWSIFGKDPKMCNAANSTATSCDYKSTARDWNTLQNQALAVSRFDPMAVTSLRFYSKPSAPANLQDYTADFGATTIKGIVKGPTINPHLGKYFAMGRLDIPTQAREDARKKPLATTVQTIRSYLSDSSKAPLILFTRYTVSGSTTNRTFVPYKVEDRCNGIFRIYVYDPYKYAITTSDLSFIDIDTVQGKWSYILSTSTTWTGNEVPTNDLKVNSQSLGVIPIDLYANSTCPTSICGGVVTAGIETIQIWVIGNGYVANAQGQRNAEIPGAYAVPIGDGSADQPFTIWVVPADGTYTTVMETKGGEVAQIGKGYVHSVTDIAAGGEVKVAADGGTLAVTNNGDQKPNISLAINGENDTSYGFKIEGVESVKVNSDQAKLEVKSSEPYSIAVTKGTQTLVANDVPSTSADVGYVDYSNTNVTVRTDEGGDGTIDQQENLTEKAPAVQANQTTVYLPNIVR